MSPARKETKDEREYVFTEDRPLVASSRNVAIPLWASIAACVGVASATIWTVNRLNVIDAKLDALSGDRWKRSYMRQYTYDLERINKGKIEVPDTDGVARRMEGQ